MNLVALPPRLSASVSFLTGNIVLQYVRFYVELIAEVKCDQVIMGNTLLSLLSLPLLLFIEIDCSQFSFPLRRIGLVFFFYFTAIAAQNFIILKLRKWNGFKQCESFNLSSILNSIRYSYLIEQEKNHLKVCFWHRNNRLEASTERIHQSVERLRWDLCLLDSVYAGNERKLWEHSNDECVRENVSHLTGIRNWYHQIIMHLTVWHSDMTLRKRVCDSFSFQSSLVQQ